MSTIQMTKAWQPEPIKNLVENNPVKEGKNISTMDKDVPKKAHFCAEDMMGLSWTLFDDLEVITRNIVDV